MKSFKILYKDKRTNARIGELSTKSGIIETPFFMPVATKAAAKYVNPKQLEKIDVKAIISNALILYIRPGTKTIKSAGGLGKFMNFNGINFTDSGGFQMYSDSIYIKQNTRGVYFRNPIDGDKIFMTPEDNMKIQLDIGADVACCLDSMPLYGKSKSNIKDAVEKTIDWAKRCKIQHDKLQKSIKKEDRQLLFSIAQGGIYKDLRKYCAEELIKLDFDGYAIGGIALPESCYNGDINKIKKIEQDMVKVHKKVIPEESAVYLMGEGDPIYLLEAIALGVDCFDSRYPTQAARRGTILTKNGKIKILNKKYENDFTSIDKKCECMVCKNFTKSYIRHLLKQDESVGRELASYHNLYYLQELIKEAKIQIKKGKFSEFLNKTKKTFSKN